MPIIQHTLQIYKLWHSFLPDIPKNARYTLGNKIDTSFVALLESVFRASHLTKEQKLPFIQNAVAKLDLIKFFLQILWETKSLDTKKYANLSEEVAKIGRMLGGWERHAALQKPPNIAN